MSATSPEHLTEAGNASTAEYFRAHRWSASLRYGFRFSFCYFFTYALCIGNATFWEAIPVGGSYLSSWLASPFRLFGQYLAVHLFHVHGVGAALHGGGSGDTAIDWIVIGEMLTLALISSLVWTALDRRRPHYQTLAAWLRFLIRLTLGMGMMVYGFAKLFPLQMQPPLLPVLNEPLGNTSPMTMLWTLIGLNPVYEMVCGGAELIAGLLILLRRTALVGALVTAFVVSNVVLYNFFFDVPVKLYATHLLLMSLFVILPDIEPLFRFFWKHELAAPHGVWVPPARRLGFRRATAVVEIVFVLLAVGGAVTNTGSRWRTVSNARRTASPLKGGWHLDTGRLAGKSQPLIAGVDQPVTALYVENPLVATMRSANGALWRTSLKLDSAKNTILVRAVGGKPVTYAIAMADNDHLQLTPTGKDAATAPTLSFTRIPLPASYQLLNRGFHWINEWGLER